jgi:DNA-binding MarR family transcriptional regulator
MAVRASGRQVGTPDGNVVLDLFVLQQRIGELMELALAGTGVRPAEYAVYSQLAVAPMTPRDLCARLGVTPSTLTGHLAALARRGHATRVRDPADGRSYRVELTGEGRRMVELCRSGFRRMLRRLTAELTEPTDVIRAMLTGVDRAAARAVEALADSQTSGR